MSKSAVSKSVSASEMMTLRESGMSNREICMATGTTLDTVLKRIGKQPKEMTIANHRKGAAEYQARRRAAKAASSAAVEVVTRSMVDIMKDSEKKIAEDDYEKAKKEAIEKAKPIIKSAKLQAKSMPVKRRRLTQPVQTAIAKKSSMSAKKAASKPGSGLKVEDHVVYLHSDHASYQYNAAAKSVAVKLSEDACFSLALDRIPSLVSDLNAIHKNAADKNLMSKAW